MEEFIFKTAKLIAKKLFGRFANEKEDETVIEEPSTNSTDELNSNKDSSTTTANTKTEEVGDKNKSTDEPKNGETDDNEFEILEKRRPSDAIAEKVEDSDYGEYWK